MSPIISARGISKRGLALAIGSLVLLQACGPKKTISSPNEAIREGWRQYRLSEFNSAVQIFQSVQASQPAGSDFHLQALYGEASCWNHRRDGRDIAKAVAAYRAALDRAPQGALAAWCALDIVRTRHLAPADQSIDYGKLSRDYAEVYRSYPNTPAGEEAFLYENSLLVTVADQERAREILASVGTFLTRHPKTPFLSQFYGIMAECCRRLDEHDRRIEYMIKALEAREVDPSNPIEDRSTGYWDIAYAAEFEAGNFALAREYYGHLIDEYPQDVRIFGVRKALERMDAIEAALREGKSPAPNLLGEISVSHVGQPVPSGEPSVKSRGSEEKLRENQ